MSLGLAGCANTDIYSGNVYEGNQAKKYVQFLMVRLFLVVLSKFKLIAKEFLVALVAVR